jgi:hypothetical protein
VIVVATNNSDGGDDKRYTRVPFNCTELFDAVNEAMKIEDKFTGYVASPCGRGASANK